MEFHCNLSFENAFFPHIDLMSINDEGPGGFRSLQLWLEQKAGREARHHRHPDIHRVLASAAGHFRYKSSSQYQISILTSRCRWFSWGAHLDIFRSQWQKFPFRYNFVTKHCTVTVTFKLYIKIPSIMI